MSLENLDTPRAPADEAVSTHLLLRAFCDELARCGLAGAVTSPGSRSTPIVLTLAAHDAIPTWSHIDERSGAFFALGVAKATGRPVALACTSGTAAANYLPALMEAREARVPLIVLTADRPPELREVGAGQVIDQVKLYGSAVKWFVDVGAHTADAGRLRWVRQLACRAFWTALESRPGVVHLNWALREPLVLDGELPADPPGGEGRPDGRPWVSRPPLAADPAEAAAMLAPIVRAAEKGVLVVGRHERRRPVGPAAAAFARAAGWPVLAEPLSGARRGPNAIAHYDALLRGDAWAASSRPDVVLRAGDLPTGKPLREWLARADAIQVALDPDGAWADPAATLDLSLAADPAAVLSALASRPVGGSADATPPSAAASTYLAAWLQADHLATQAIDATLGEPLSEPRVARELGARLPSEATLVVSASMPIRDVETFWGVRDDPPRVLSNRGANGIDGVVSTAFGVAAGSAGPVVALIGDVALAYDIGALVSARRLRLALTIVLVDNEGGGIFDFLPVAGTRPRERYEVHVATPPQLDFADVAVAFGLTYRPATTVPELRRALDAGLAGDAVTLVHVHTDRAHNVRLHRQVWAAVMRAL
jgi:2-succinyl-5-enolpyruvyl-6-hydroxy-3-cyclohexene-1-carboxylate synthase